MTIHSEETPKSMDENERLDGPSLEEPPSIDEQKEIISEYLKEPLKKGETWYLICTRWFKQWQSYVGFNDYCDLDKGKEISFPGPIDNTPLFKDITKSDDLKDHMMEEIDYHLLPIGAWEDLMKWYGMVDGSKTLARKVQEHGQYVKDLKVEVYLPKLKLCRNSELENCVVKEFSKTATLDDVMQEMRIAFSVPEDKDIRIWNRYMSSTYELLKNTSSTIQDAGLYDGQVVVMEQKNDDGSWPRHTRSSSISNTSGASPTAMESSSFASGWSPGSSSFSSTYGLSYGSSYSGYSDETRRRRTSSGSGSGRAGLCGLSNLGNTCFMNSALQCLSNTAPLAKYFIAGNYKNELNPQNPLGMRGEIAIAYAELMLQIWSGHHSFVSPRNFKVAVGRFAPQFSGYQQQDSHELLAFLLDGLHEDLNRVKKKPYVEIPDHDGRPDDELAHEAWANHQLRNCSIIVDLFHGLFKSTVVCPMCSKISVTFDPFCYLSLPLPVVKERSLSIVFVPLESTKRPVLMKVVVPKAGTVSDLTVVVAKMTGVEASKLVIAEVYSHRFHKFFERRDALSHITEKDHIYAFEVPMSKDDTRDSELVVLPVYLRLERSSSLPYSTYCGSPTLFGTPMLVPVPRKGVNYDDLYQIILRSLRRVMKPQNEDDNDKAEDEVNGEDSGDDEGKIKEDGYNQESDKNEEPIENDETQPKNNKNRKLFCIKSVNSYGNSELHSFAVDDDDDLRLTNNTYLAIDWKPKWKKLYFDEDADEDIDEHPSVRQKGPREKTIQLQDCLELFLTKEKLGAEDPWYCPTCKKHQQASKKFDLWGLPTVLVIHLKRFSYNRWWRDKIDSLVDFPIRDLNLTPYVIDKEHPPAVYDLHAVSNHYGGMGGGHYTAYCKNFYDGKWYYFDDSSVSIADENQIVSKAAYVLFYTRRKDPAQPPHPGNEFLSDDETAVFQSQDTSSDEGDFDMET
ncbi:ubiquitin carboxyl-terminal hydrolase 15-like [Rhopilema esculentum]|uniref:ubiquitin carboxyl-terminal hydrolase 15-like n=1 Tax=Rhopilema esculentum TaxID=499914 RepID=UPI0031D7165D|eukprot:gene449-10121_t